MVPRERHNYLLNERRLDIATTGLLSQTTPNSACCMNMMRVGQSSREQRLATGRLYGVICPPQYAAILLAVFGQGVHWPTISTVALLPAIMLIYDRLALTEEKEMLQHLGAPYHDYLQQVQMLFPWRCD